MKCKGSYYSGSIMAEEIHPADVKSEKVCGSEAWELIWRKVLKGKDSHANMYQCMTCKRLVMAPYDLLYSEKWV